MTSQFPLLALPFELRCMVYGYVAHRERLLRIKRKCRPRKGYFIATTCGLILVNRQVSDEYIDSIQTIAREYGILLRTWVHDFNFRHVEQYIKALQKRHHVPLPQRMFIRIQLCISSCINIDAEKFAHWILIPNKSWLDLRYIVVDARSGHTYPSPPPEDIDIDVVKAPLNGNDQAEKIYKALQDWQRRRRISCYVVRSRNPFADMQYFEWMQYDGDDEYVEVSSASRDHPITEVWVD